ncbi:MAG: hypothetical protein Q7S96_03115 [bacterium]|nr:hypothetical protein [bacterium]
MEEPITKSYFDEKFDGFTRAVDEKIGGLARTMDEKIGGLARAMDEQIGGLARAVKEGFDRVDERFDAVDERFNTIEGDIADLKYRMRLMEGEIQALSANMVTKQYLDAKTARWRRPEDVFGRRISYASCSR